MSNNIRCKVECCDLILQFCNTVHKELSFVAKPIKSIIDEYNCPYITKECLQKNYVLTTPLTKSENKRIGDFLYSLGKSDLKSQLRSIEIFEEYINRLKDKYEKLYHSKSKLYITFCACCGMIFGLVFV